MKTRINNCLITTAIALLLLSIIAALYQAQFLCISTVFEVLLANGMIHIGLMAIEHFESSYFFIEILIKLGFINMVLIVFGMIFDWYSSTPLWILAALGIVVYIIGVLMDAFILNNDVIYINRALKQHRDQRKKKN